MPNLQQGLNKNNFRMMDPNTNGSISFAPGTFSKLTESVNKNSASSGLTKFNVHIVFFRN